MDMSLYNKELETKVQIEFNIAKKARHVGVESSMEPEIYIAKDLADKVEGLIGQPGLAEIIRKLQKSTKNEEEIAFKIVDEIISKEPDIEKAADTAIRASLAFLTQGSVAAPLEGIAKVRILKNPDDTKYLAVYYAGPIRAAGGTAEAISVVVSDYVRKALGLNHYKPTIREISRYVEEIQWYNRYVRLQYLPSVEEIETIVKNVPICVDGEPTEKFEVVNNRDLGRVKTNKVRGGMCLVIAEGIAQKAPKLLRRLKPIQESYGLDWSWLEGIVAKKATEEKPEFQKKISSLLEKETPKEFQYDLNEDLLSISELSAMVKEHGSIDLMEDYEEEPAKGSEKFLREIPAGRPVFSYPSRKGGFNLRYGRTRASGYAALSINPATMHILDDFIATGTQLRLELPGKAGIATPCDSINGPTVLLDDDSVVEIDTYEDAKKLSKRVKRILNLGDILISAGDFFENNHQLLPPAYRVEWWSKQVRKAITEKKGLKTNLILRASRYTHKPYPNPTLETAIDISQNTGVPLHPKYAFYWNFITNNQLKQIADALKKAEIKEDSIEFENTPKLKKALEGICLPHRVKDSKIIILGEPAKALLFSLDYSGKGIIKICKIINEASSRYALKTINKLCTVKIMDAAPTQIGARMGRPEKAKPRKMVPTPHVLFPTGVKKGRVRNLMKLYAEEKNCTPILAKFKCEQCNSFELYPRCSKCSSQTRLLKFCPKCKTVSSLEICKSCGLRTTSSEPKSVNIKELLEKAAVKLNKKLPTEIKGVLAMSSKDKIPEAIEKGVLRALFEIYVFKDGTIRYDSTDAPLTHFKPKEVKVSVEKLKKIGYTTDMDGKKLENDEQLLELKPQDIIISDYSEESASSYLVKTAKFVDSLLTDYYKLPPYYNIMKKEDLVGQLVIGLAPHTSTGIVGRIVGFTDAKVCFAHPCFHDAKRRDCDGDEDAVMLLLDALLNFSKSFLPEKRGGSMDAPLVITSKLNPLEIDDEVYDVDIVADYPLSFYEAAEKKADPNEVELLTFGDTIHGDDPFSGWSFTHNVSDINNAPISNKYTEGEMKEKLKRQLDLAEIIDAVDEKDVAKRIINTHFLPDMKGNLRTFSKQKVRCTKCNAKYRRPPLVGNCLRCGGHLTMTVHRGTIEKYMHISKEMVEKYKMSPYISQQIDLLERSVNSIFGKESQSKLNTFN